MWLYLYVIVRVYVRVYACVFARMRACVRECVREREGVCERVGVCACACVYWDYNSPTVIKPGTSDIPFTT